MEVGNAAVVVGIATMEPGAALPPQANVKRPNREIVAIRTISSCLHRFGCSIIFPALGQPLNRLG